VMLGLKAAHVRYDPAVYLSGGPFSYIFSNGYHRTSYPNTKGVPANATRLRYLWYNNPCGAAPYGCPIYVPVSPIGADSGEMPFLPLGPFIADLP
jgi:hypothetical protein